MGRAVIQQSTLKFLKDLSGNNNRDWFNANKDRYQDAYQNAEMFFDQLIEKMNGHDQSKRLPVKKACTGSTTMSGFRRIKRPIVHGSRVT